MNFFRERDKMRGNDDTANVESGYDNKIDGDSVTQVRRSDEKAEGINKLACDFDCRDYRRSIPRTENKLENNLEPQHGVTPCGIDSALQHGLSALGYAPQWALPTDCVPWEYQQEPLIVCDDTAHVDWDLCCKDTKKIPNVIDGNTLRGVNDFYDNLHRAYQSALTTPKSSSPIPPRDAIVVPNYVVTNPLSPDYLKALNADWPWWERTYPPVPISLPACESSDHPNPPVTQSEPEDCKSSSNDIPYDLSIPKKSSNDISSTNHFLKSTNSNSTIPFDSTSLTVDLPASLTNDSTKKLNVDEENVKNERIVDTRNILRSGNLARSHWDCADMSGQYPGHSRPPVGTPPPQTVWNHLTMTQGQAKNTSGGRGSTGGGPPAHETLPRSYERVQSDLTYLLSEVSGLNMHPTGLSGASLSPAGFYTHPSMARAASHLTSQLTPQLAHTQAPPTWHTPTVPSKNVTASNAPGNPLYSLQMLVDNRQNQNQYRNSPGSQSTLDLSSTSEIAENYSRMTHDIPISLTARNVDKGSRNGNIISPPIPLNGETSSDSGISSSVPTPNSVIEPVSLSTKELTTPKITVKNFESNLKGVANLHDKMKEMTADNFVQKVINLPSSVTIERVLPSDKKDNDQQSAKIKDTLSVIAQAPRNVLPVIVNLTSRMDKDVIDSPIRESSSERDRKLDESVRSPKNMPKRGKKGVDSLLEKLEGGNKKLGSTENIGSVIVAPLEDKDTSSVMSMSPERQKSKSPTREDDVVSPAFSNDDSNDNTKQRRKRKLEKPVRLSKDSKTEVEDMELEPTEPREPRTCEITIEQTRENVPTLIAPTTVVENILESTTTTFNNTVTTEKSRIDDKTSEITELGKIDDNERIKRRRSSEGPSSNQTPTSQRTRRKSSDDATEFSKVTSPRANNGNPFNEVESELEKMFAGIVEDEDKNDDEKTETTIVNETKKEENAIKTEEDGVTTEATVTKIIANTNVTDVTSTVETKQPAKRGKKGKVRGGKRKISRNSDSAFVATMDDVAPRESKKRRGSKAAKKTAETPTKRPKRSLKPDGLREIAYDSGSNASSIRSRGPVVHVEGPRDSPLSVQVVNAPREDEEEKSKEKRKSVGNGNTGRSKRLSHQNDLDYRGKVSRAGLFSSTLSSRYDAHTTDSSWVCVFCKQGPHSVVPGDPARPHPNLAGPHIAPGTYTVPSGVLSDLFGPYLIGKERLEEGILSADEQEITTEQKKGGKNKRSLRYAGLADQFSAKMGKKKRNSIESFVTGAFTGMTMLPGEEQRWEVWLHEQCALWAAGVYMAGGRVTGLQEAVWDSTKSICDACGLTGANIGCVKRGCKAVTHYPCALSMGWLLDTSQYIPKCNLHRVT